MRKYYLLVSDFDQTLSFNDSGLVLAEMMGIPDFQERVLNLARLNLVQSGAERGLAVPPAEVEDPPLEPLARDEDDGHFGTLARS